MREKIVRFGDRQGLVGVLCEPRGSAKLEDTPAAIMVNAGLLHRIGPYRSYVDICRTLAAKGFSSLRFDITGLGDSVVNRQDDMHHDDRAVQDIQHAMDFLQDRKGFNRYVLMGLCSGAYNAYNAVVHEPRAAGAVFLDGYAHRTIGFYLRHTFDRALNIRWWRKLPGLVRAKLNQREWTDLEREAYAQNYFFEYPESGVVGKQLETVLDRPAELLFVYTIADRLFNHPRQFREMFGDLADHPRLAVEFSKSEHSYSYVIQRRTMVEQVTSWMEQRFGGKAIVPTASEDTAV